MKNNVFRLKALVLILALPLLLAQSVFAQMPCTVSLISSANPTNPLSYSFTANLNGSGPQCNDSLAQFSWNYGDGGQGSGLYTTHTYNAPGAYMVCLTANFSGMTLVQCDTILVGNVGPNCEGLLNFDYIQVQGTANTYVFDNYTPLTGNNCFSSNTVFLWTFGIAAIPPVYTVGAASVTQTFSGTGPFTVCLSTMTPSGDTVTLCKTVVAPQPSLNLMGMVKANGQCLNSTVLVELYGLSDNTYQSQTLNGMADSCFYWFNVQNPLGVPAKQYIIRATPTTGDDYMATYFGDVLFWENATILQPTQNNFNLDINLIPNFAATATGPGTVSGTISGNGTVVNTTFNNLNLSTPFNVSASRVIILNAQGQPVGFALVNSDGTFSYPDLPVGNYQLRVDNPRIPSVVIPFSINASTTGAVINLVANGTGIVSVTRNGQHIQAEEVQVYPNPASDVLNFSGNTGMIKVLDATGRQVLRSENSTTLNISALKAGVYTVETTDAQQRPLRTRFIKK
jgi:PKD repeat protein